MHTDLVKKVIRRIKKILTNLIIDEDLIIQKIDAFKLNQLNQFVAIDSTSRLYPEADVYNMQNDKNKIIIKKNCHLRGELLVLPYSQGIVIGNNCYLGKNSIIRSYEKITIGNSVLIAHNVTIIDSDSHEINYIERDNGYINILTKGHGNDRGNIKCSPIDIKDNVWISYNVAILKGVTIGEGAIIAAGSVVTKDVEPFTIVAGNPAKVIRKLNDTN